MTPKEFLIQVLAESIADDIMTSGDADKAHRLKLFDRIGREMGGWSKRSLTSRIEKHLRGELSRDHWQFWNEKMQKDEVVE